jgi:hypothetical protein
VYERRSTGVFEYWNNGIMEKEYPGIFESSNSLTGGQLNLLISPYDNGSS